MRMSHTPRCPGSRERGAAAVEFALILPLLLLLLLGMIEFGRAFHAQISLTHASREAVRVHALGTADPVAVAESAASTISPVTVACDATACASAECVRAQPTSVTVSHDFEFIVPMFGTTLTLTGVGEMRCGG